MYIQLRQLWQKLDFRGKLTLLLVASATVPVFVSTQTLITIAQTNLTENLQGRIRIQLNALEAKLNDLEKEVNREAEALATFVEYQGENVENSENSENKTEQLVGTQKLILNYVRTKANESFYLITDEKGKTIGQYIQETQDDFSTYSALPSSQLKETTFRPISLSSGIDLGDIPIVKDALTYRRSLAGKEIFKSEWLKRLGLDKQGNIGIRSQKIEGLPEPKQPFPLGNYEIDEGKAGLVIVAVQPIQIEGKLIGTAIVGTLINRNYEIVDRLQQETGVSTSTLFVYDWRVSTNVPYTDQKTRAIGTRVAREVAEKVLNQKQVFIGATNIIGTNYLTGYSPIFDHQQKLYTNSAKPVGIAYVGEPKNELTKTLNMLRIAGWLLAGGIALLAVSIAFLVASTFSNSLKRLAESAQKVGAGDLTISIPITNVEDEVGKLQMSFRTMINNLTSLIQQVQKSGIQITTSTTQISAAGKQLEATVTEQAASTNQVAATAKEIAATSNQLVKTMDEVGYTSQATATDAAESQKELAHMEQTMRTLAGSTGSISTKLGTISEKANNINSIITTITKVADQTNLLSLNAAIEAEKAGEYGTGFAVVAREIRRLADQTAVATLDIENMVKEMQGAVSTGVMEMDKFTKEVERGVDDVTNISNKLESIIEQVQTLTPRFQQVSASMEAQSQGAQQISQAMLQLTEASGQTVVSLREVNGTIGQLNDVAQDLRQEVSRFKVV